MDVSLSYFLWMYRPKADFCKENRGHLASVTTLEVHNCTQSKVDADDSRTFFWVGGTDQELEGKWTWTDWNLIKWVTIRDITGLTIIGMSTAFN